ncbi:hypothetical protein K440DRAFT_640127 [Wilcoxina mikolae CBS 423.85]|nr:hypothetical protein K440DRAFT_640127 [Wilcoxina mikolae CBS 423.85]
MSQLSVTLSPFKFLSDMEAILTFSPPHFICTSSTCSIITLTPETTVRIICVFIMVLTVVLLFCRKKLPAAKEPELEERSSPVSYPDKSSPHIEWNKLEPTYEVHPLVNLTGRSKGKRRASSSF